MKSMCCQPFSFNRPKGVEVSQTPKMSSWQWGKWSVQYIYVREREREREYTTHKHIYTCICIMYIYVYKYIHRSVKYTRKRDETLLTVQRII